MRLIESLYRDLRHAVRGLPRSPGFAITVMLSIGLGIGANTTVFAWIDNIVRNPFPAIPDGGRLVALNVGDVNGHTEGMPPVAFPIVEEWRSRVSAFDEIAAHSIARLSVRTTPGDSSEPVWAEIVSPNFFDAVRVDPALGRSFDAADAANRADVVVLSHALWQRRFGGASDTIGRRVLFNGVSLTVVGIAPPRFGGVVMGLAFDAWVPIWQQATLLPGADWSRDRTVRRMQAVARLRPGVALSQAQQELNGVALNVSRSIGESPLTGASARWVSDTQLGSLMGPLGLAMLVVTAVVLLTACANVAGLLLARGVSQQRQTAIRVAIGASRARIVQQALVQNGVLALSGCLIGLSIAQACKGVLTAFVPRVALPVNLEIDLNWRVGLFAAAISMAAAMLFALFPTLRASRPDVIDILKASAGTGLVRRSRFRQALVVAQVSFSLVSLAMAGLFLRSVALGGQIPLGFGDPTRVLLLSTDLSFTRLSGEPLVALADRALERVRAVPGVADASFATFVPLSFGGPPAMHTRVEGYVPAQNESMFVDAAAVTDEYFETMQIPVVEGRSIQAADRLKGLRVAVVNEGFVARFWPGKSAVGR